jgi:hypothetical protein
MPSTSKKQHKFMAAVANNPKFAKKAGVQQSVGEDFMQSDSKMPMPKKRPSMMAPKRAAMPRPRPSMEDREMQDTLDRGESSSRYEAEDMMIPKMAKGGKVKKMKKMMGGGMTKAYKEGGKVRGYGMARGGKACKMR